MIRTQIQLPDAVYARAKKLAKEQEISFAEIARRGIEYMLSVYPSQPMTKTEWKPLTFDMGWNGLTDEQLKEIAQMTSTEEALIAANNEQSYAVDRH